MTVRTLYTMALLEGLYASGGSKSKPGLTIPLAVPIPYAGVTGVWDEPGEELLNYLARLAQESGMQVLLFELEVTASYFCKCDIQLPSYTGWKSLCNNWPYALQSTFRNVQYQVSYQTHEFCSLASMVSYDSLRDHVSESRDVMELDAIVYGFNTFADGGEPIELATIIRPSCIRHIEVVNSVHPEAARLGKLAIASLCWNA